MKEDGAGVAIGIALGVAVGAAIDNIGLGIALGLALGVTYEMERKNKAKAGSDAQVSNSDKGKGGSTAQKDAKAKHLDEVLAFARGKESITNNEIEKLLGVSDATAERYLNELEKEGKLEQVGNTGKGVYYKIK